MENDIKKVLIDLAKISIYDKLNNTNTISKDEFLEKLPNFEKKAATFVTLTINGNLRGCIGSLIPHVSLFDDITTNAKKAAFEDPRFPQLTVEEFENTKVEISLLSQATEVKYKDFYDLKSKLIPNKHGVILRLDRHQATFLPQVWDQLPTFELFMTHLYQKAGLDLNKENKAPEIFTYTVEKIEDE